MADGRTPQPEDRPDKAFRIKDHLAEFVVGVLVLVVAAAIIGRSGLSGDNGSTPTSTIPVITARFKAGNYSGISQIPGAQRLDIAENLRIRG